MLYRRFWAFAIDLFIISLGARVLSMAYLDFMNDHFGLFGPFFYSDLAMGIKQIHIFVLYLLFVGYFSISLYLSDGKTMGNLFLGLRVLSNDSDGQPLNFFQCFQRSMGGLFCLFFGLFPFLLVFLTRDRRGLPDFLGHSHIAGEQKIFF